MSQGITLVSYTKKYQYAFKQLNEEWIQTYFRMEEADYKALDNPQAYILKNGGYIVMALDGKNAVGTCALIKHDNATYELAKMAVSPLAQGKGVGFLLGQHIIEKAKDLGASKIFLESNTILKPAINLYYKLGFVKITGRPSPYERSNIQMELNLK
jgi:GNAT superfamily N-acetyltransferase